MPSNQRRLLPSVQDLLETPPLKLLRERLTHSAVASRVRSFLDDVRTDLKTAAADFRLSSPAELAESLARRIAGSTEPRLRPVINATGLLLNADLGGAPLAEEAWLEIAAVTRDYASLECDLPSGERSPRVAAVENLLREATSAEAALVVNAQASGLLLSLAVLAADQEVVAARGDLVDFGDGYRLTDVVQASGARLREVGAANLTQPDDYRRALGERSAALLRVHTGDPAQSAAESSTSLENLVQIGRERSLPVIHELGAGGLLNLDEQGLAGEPVAAESIRAGADLVLFGGDKLLGGPECGIIVGRRKLVEQIARHPLASILRADKLTLAALAATLRLYGTRSDAFRNVPILSLLSAPLDNLKQRAVRLAAQLSACAAIDSAEAMEAATGLGSGTLESRRLPTWCIALRPARLTVERLAESLRTGMPPVVGRLDQQRLLLDLRSVFPRQDVLLVEAVEALEPSPAAGSPSTNGP